MTARLSHWMKSRPLVSFYLLAFAITWLGWLPQAAYSRGWFPFDSPIFYVLGGVGPLLAVWIVLRVTQPDRDFWSVFRPFLQWRASFFWYLFALFGYTALNFLSLWLSGNLAAEVAKLAQPLALLPTFLIFFAAAIPEEVAWRGYALPRLQSRFGALFASLIAGLLWALWHLPLLWNTNNLMSTYALLPFVLDVMARTVVYTWIFNNTRGSLLFITLFHASSNTIGAFVGYENFVVNLAFDVFLVLAFGADTLTGKRELAEQKDVSAVAS